MIRSRPRTRLAASLSAALLLAVWQPTLAAARGGEDPPPPAHPQKGEPNYTRTEDVIYGRRDGLALTMDVFTPRKPNGAGVIVFVSAEFHSGRELFAMFHPLATTPFLDRGYVVFAVMHGSQPRYTVPEVVEDAHRAVRFVKHAARKYGVDPDKVGAAGGSAGGHLSLMMGCAGRPGDPKAADPVERLSSRVAAVACFFPPSDFAALEKAPWPKGVAAAFDFRELDPATGTFVSVPPERRRAIGREVSPLTHAARGAAPALIIHGDRDEVVPVEQSKAMAAKLKSNGVPCELVVKEGRGHFGPWVARDMPALADWFDRHLLGKK